jgi:nicotinamidase-related amidase
LIAQRLKEKREFKDIPSMNSKTAILVIDMIMEFCYPGGWCDLNGLDYSYSLKCVDPINALIAWGRKKGCPIIFSNWGLRDPNSLLPANQTQLWKVPGRYDVGLEAGGFLKGTSSVETIKEIDQRPEDLVVSKERITGFYETELDQNLKRLRIENIFFAGVNTDQCVLATMADANYRGYNCILVKECCGTNSPEYARDGALYNAHELFGRVLSLREIIEESP